MVLQRRNENSNDGVVMAVRSDNGRDGKKLSTEKNSSESVERIAKMSVNDENVIVGSDSFWEIGQYKRTVRRIEDGLRLCQDLMAMIKERGEIEVAYAKSLQAWSKKWSDNIEKSPAYSTTKAAWKGVLVEADGLAELHHRVRDRLHEEVYSTVKCWLKDNYHKNTFGGIKESKETEELFKTAQKPWAKMYQKVDKNKKEYYHASRQERTAINQDKNAQGDESISVEQQKKLAEKASKCTEEREKAEEDYKKSVDEIKRNNSKYIEDMKQVFARCQDFEQKRLRFFQEMLFGMHKCLDLSDDKTLKTVYQSFWDTIELANSEQDLKWWAQNHGDAMAMCWPEFEEYRPELKPINKKQMKGEDGIVLVGQKSAMVTGPGVHNPNLDTQKIAPRPSIPNASGNQHANVYSNENSSNNRHSQAQPMTSSTSEPNPYEDDWEDNFVDNGQPGVSVRALYDYAGQEADELTLTKGDIFEKLADPDEQGWCKGRKNGRIGLYPANYAEPAN